VGQMASLAERLEVRVRVVVESVVEVGDGQDDPSSAQPVVLPIRGRSLVLTCRCVVALPIEHVRVAVTIDDSAIRCPALLAAIVRALENPGADHYQPGADHYQLKSVSFPPKHVTCLGFSNKMTCPGITQIAKADSANSVNASSRACISGL